MGRRTVQVDRALAHDILTLVVSLVYIRQPQYIENDRKSSTEIISRVNSYYVVR